MAVFYTMRCGALGFRSATSDIVFFFSSIEWYLNFIGFVFQYGKGCLLQCAIASCLSTFHEVPDWDGSWYQTLYYLCYQNKETKNMKALAKTETQDTALMKSWTVPPHDSPSDQPLLEPNSICRTRSSLDTTTPSRLPFSTRTVSLNPSALQPSHSPLSLPPPPPPRPLSPSRMAGFPSPYPASYREHPSEPPPDAPH